MIKCFLVPMTEPPYSRENNQRPKYVDEIRANWSGSPLFNAKYYIIKVNSDNAKLAQFMSKPDVIDFDENDEAFTDDAIPERKNKDKEIKKILKLNDPVDKNGAKVKEKVKDFINRAARSEGNFAWDKDSVYVPE